MLLGLWPLIPYEYLLTHLLLLWDLAVSITVLPSNQNSTCINSEQTNQVTQRRSVT